MTTIAILPMLVSGITDGAKILERLGELREATQLSSALGVLSAMITPAVLILACGSLILTTSNRLTRVIDRVREISTEIETLASKEPGEQALYERRSLLSDLLTLAIRRTRLLQKSLTRLYIALSMFVGTSMAIGLLALTHVDFAAIALLLGFIGAFFMLWSSVSLIAESRVGLASTFREMDFLQKRGEYFGGAELQALRKEAGEGVIDRTR